MSYYNEKKYPWYLSLWFIYFLMIFSILIIPAIIAAFLVSEREKLEEELVLYLETLEHQRQEVEKVYNQREEILEAAREQISINLKETDKRCSEMVRKAEEKSYNILCSAEQDKIRILSDFTERENKLVLKENYLNIKEEELENALSDVVRKLNLFSHRIDEYKNDTKSEYLKKNIGNNTEDDNDNDESEDIFDTLKIKIPDDSKE